MLWFADDPIATDADAFRSIASGGIVAAVPAEADGAAAADDTGDTDEEAADDEDRDDTNHDDEEELAAIVTDADAIARPPERGAARGCAGLDGAARAAAGGTRYWSCNRTAVAPQLPRYDAPGALGKTFKLHDHALGGRALRAAWATLGWREVRAAGPATLMTHGRGTRGKTIFWQGALSGAVGGSKAGQQASRVAFAHRCGCRYDDLRIAPETFALARRQECARWKAYARAPGGDARSWIVKKHVSFHGRSMSVHLAGTQTRLTDQKLDRRYCGKHFIAQRYVDPLLLHGKYKFDFRVYMLVARADPWVVYYRDGFVRRALVPFSEGGQDSHITNTFATVRASESTRDGGKVRGEYFTHYDYVWNLVDFQRHLLRRYERDNPGKRLPPNFVRDTMRPYLKQVLRYVFLAAAAHKRKGLTGYLHRAYKPGTVNMWALDFVMDADLNIFLLEGNGGPTINQWHLRAAGGLPDLLWASALTLVTRLQMDAWPRDAPPLHEGGWELVHSEVGEACAAAAIGKPYDACGLFAGRSNAEVARSWPYAAPAWPPPGAPFEVTAEDKWYGPQERREAIVKRDVGAGLEFRE